MKTARLYLLLFLGLGLAATARAQDKPADDDPVDPLAVEQLYPEVLMYEHLYEGMMASPYGVVCDYERREVHVADTNGDLIGIFDVAGTPLFAFADPGRMKSPFALAVDSRGRIFVLDAERDRVKIYSYRGEFLKYQPLEGTKGKGDVVFTAIALDGNGDIFLGEALAGEVLVFDANGRLKRTMGQKGSGPGQFQNVQGIALDGTNVYVADSASLGIQVFDKYGKYLRGWGRHEIGAANVSLPAGIAVDKKGRVWLVDTMRHDIKAYTSTGKFIDQFAGAGQDAGEVNFPVGLGFTVGPKGVGLLCVADKGNGRVQIFSIREPKSPAKPPADAPPSPEKAPERR